MLVLKLTFVPILIAVVSLVAQRFGVTVAGFITGFPIVGGPIFLFLVAEQGEQFGVHAAIGILVGLVAWAAFTLCYSWVCRSCPWFVSILLASMAFLVAVLPLSLWQPDLLIACVVGIAVPVLTPVLMPRMRCRASTAAIPVPLPRFEIMLRMLAAAALVLIVTEAARFSGPMVAGLLASFPVGLSVLAAFSQRLHGADAAVHVLRGTVVGIYGYAVFFIVAGTVLPAYGIRLACAAALLAALIAQTIAFRSVARL